MKKDLFKEGVGIGKHKMGLFQCEYPGHQLKYKTTYYWFGSSYTWPGPEKHEWLTKTERCCQYLGCERRAKWWGYGVEPRKPEEAVYSIYDCPQHGFQFCRLVYGPKLKK